MSSITISLSDDHWRQLQAIAAQFGIAPEELARVSLEDLLTRPEDDFRRALEHVLNKNAELYRRLA